MNTKRVQYFIDLLSVLPSKIEAMKMFNTLIPQMEEFEKGLVAFWLACEKF